MKGERRTEKLITELSKAEQKNNFTYIFPPKKITSILDKKKITNILDNNIQKVENICLFLFQKQFCIIDESSSIFYHHQLLINDARLFQNKIEKKNSTFQNFLSIFLSGHKDTQDTIYRKYFLDLSILFYFTTFKKTLNLSFFSPFKNTFFTFHFILLLQIYLKKIWNYK